MASDMTSRERIRAAMRHEPTDHLPLCFEGVCHGAPRFIVEAYPDPLDRACYYLEREIDTAVMCSPPFFSSRGFATQQWRDQPADERYPVLHKEYKTPAGSLWQVVRKTDDYPEQVDLFSDHNVPPGRSLTYLVTEEQHLAALEWIFRPLDDDELTDYFERAKHFRAFCDRERVLMGTYVPGVGDPLIWLSGVENAVVAALESPSFWQQYVDIIARWDRRLVECAIEAGCDHVVRRGWYESTDFWSPSLYERYLLEPLQAEVRLAHEAGLTFDYVMNTGAMPLLSYFAKTRIDMLSNVDAQAPRTDLAAMKNGLGQTIALCGGINNHQVMEMGTEGQVRAAVQEAADLLAPGGGYVMAPGDALGYIKVTDTVVHNFEVMVEAWREIRFSEW
jgi:hypothetical protein